MRKIIHEIGCQDLSTKFSSFSQEVNMNLEFLVFSVTFSEVFSAIPVGNRFPHGIFHFFFQPNENMLKLAKS
jgi:hypothetical protein